MAGTRRCTGSGTGANFDAFCAPRKQALLELVAGAMGKSVGDTLELVAEVDRNGP